MTELTLNNNEDRKIYFEILNSINNKRGSIFKKINIFILIINFLLLVSLLISAIYLKKNIFYFFTILPIVLMIILPILFLKINANREIKDIERFVDNNNKLFSYLLNKEISVNKFKIKIHSKMYGKNKNFLNEIINQTIKQLKEL